MSQVIAVYDGSDNWLQNFVWNDEVDGIQMLEQKDVLDYDTDGNTTELTRSFYHRNALGSVMEITDANQAAVASYRYDPYGSVTITRGGQTQSSDPLGQHWGFTGRFHDEESGLCYYRARYYDPATGRFLQRDSLGYVEGPNLFEYVESQPITIRDPSGNQGEDDEDRDPSGLLGQGQFVPPPEPEPEPEMTPEEVEKYKDELEEEEKKRQEELEKLKKIPIRTVPVPPLLPVPRLPMPPPAGPAFPPSDYIEEGYGFFFTRSGAVLGVGIRRVWHW